MSSPNVSLSVLKHIFRWKYSKIKCNEHNTIQPKQTESWMFLFEIHFGKGEHFMYTCNVVIFISYMAKTKDESLMKSKKMLASNSICTSHTQTWKQHTQNKTKNFNMENVLFDWIHSLSLLFSISCVPVHEMQNANCKL